MNEAPAASCGGILSGIPPKPYPPSLLRATAGRLAIPLCSKLQSILAKANEGTAGFCCASGNESDVAKMIPSWEKIDHLSYLKNHSIFEGVDHGQTCETALICASCGHEVTKVSEKLDVRGRHDHAFSYYRQIVRLGCFRNAPGCESVQGVSHGYSWFRGYAWQIQVCRECLTQLGWKYISPDESFYGLIFETLREEESDIPATPDLFSEEP